VAVGHRTFPLPSPYRTFPLGSLYRTFPLPYIAAPNLSTQMVVLVEIDWPSGTRYYSHAGVSTPGQWYKDQLVSLGVITRDIPMGAATLPSFSDATMVLDNADEEFSILRATDQFRSINCRIRFGPASSGLAAMPTLFTGWLFNWNISGGKLNVTLRSSTFDRFRVVLGDQAKTLTPQVFPDLPISTNPPRLVPIVRGTVNSTLNGGSAVGATPAYMISTGIANQTWSSIAFGNNIYVGVAADGSVATSTSGQNWVPRLAPELNNWTSVTYSAALGLFVAVASSGTNRVMTSPDGIIWTARAAASASAWTGVAWSPSLVLFVAVASSANIMTSPDGTTWTTRTAPAGFAANAVEWSADQAMFSTVNFSSVDGINWIDRTSLNNFVKVVWASGLNLFVATGTSGIMTSPDAVTWTVRVAGFSAGRALAYSSSLGLLVAANTTGFFSSTDGITWTARTAIAQVWNTITWAASINAFVAIASSGTIRAARSTNGTAWTQIAETPAHPWGEVEWGAGLGLFVAVPSDTSGIALSSPNGYDWTPHGFVALGFQGVAFAPTLGTSGRFCAVSNSATAATSDDGLTWTQRSIAAGDFLNGVVWADTLNLFVAVGFNGKVETSPDGITWTSRTPASAAAWLKIAWNGTTLVAVGAAGAVQTSTDGINWTLRTAAAANRWESVVWAAGLSLFVAVSSDGTNRVMTSPTGTTWTSRSAAAANSWLKVIWAPALTLLIACSKDGTNRVMTSPDGTTWTSRSIPVALQWGTMAWAPSLGRVVVMSQDFNAGNSEFSSDGINWKVAKLDANTWNSVTWAPALSIFAAVAQDGTNRVATSAEGENWTMRSAAQANQWQAITWAPSLALFTAVSIDGTNRVMTSPDAVTWTVRSASQANSWRDVLWSAWLALFVAVSSDGTNRVMTSPDGSTWTNRTAPTTGGWWALADSGAKLTAVHNVTGDTSRPMTSTDGTTWTSVVAAEANTWRSIVWSHPLGLFAAVSSDGTNRVSISANGLGWTPAAAAAANQWWSIGWNTPLGLFAAVSLDGTNRIMTSANGTSWTSRSAPAAIQWTAITGGGGSRFVAIANTGTNNRSMVSSDGTTWTGFTNGSFRYVITQGFACTVINVYNYGVLVPAANYAAWTATYGGVTMSGIDLNFDPRSATRKGETELAVDVTVTDGASGNPVLELKELLKSYASLQDSDLDTASWSAAQALATSLGYLGGFSITDRNLAIADVVGQFNESFVMWLYATRDGAYAVYLYDLAAPAAAGVEFTDENDIVKNTFQVLANPDIADCVQYNYAYNAIPERASFEHQPVYPAAGRVRSVWSLWYVQDAATAKLVAQRRWSLYQEAQDYASFSLPIDNYLIELTQAINITHFQGISPDGNGWQSQPARIVELQLNPQPSSMSITARAQIINPPILDTFTRADSAASAYPIGLSWLKFENDPGVLRVLSDAFYSGWGTGGVGGVGLAYWNVYAAGSIAEQFSALVYKSDNSGLAGPSVRDNSVSATSISNYTALYDAANQLIKLMRYSAANPATGGGTVLASYSALLLPGDVLKIAAVGNRIFVYISDILVIGPIIDSTFATGFFGALSNAASGKSITWSQWAGGRALAA
jgi:hypothetical protein